MQALHKASAPPGVVLGSGEELRQVKGDKAGAWGHRAAFVGAALAAMRGSAKMQRSALAIPKGRGFINVLPLRRADEAPPLRYSTRRIRG